MKGNLYRASAVVAAMVLAIAGLLVVLAEQPAQAAFPGLNGRIAFEKNGEIWTTDAQGTDQQNLMPGPKQWQPPARMVS